MLIVQTWFVIEMALVFRNAIGQCLMATLEGGYSGRTLEDGYSGHTLEGRLLSARWRAAIRGERWRKAAAAAKQQPSAGFWEGSSNNLAHD